MAVPGAVKLESEPVLAINKAGDCVAGIVKLKVGETVLPDLADAVLVRPPASTSACVVVPLAEQISEPPGARPAGGNAGHVTLAILLSVTVMAVVSVVLPELVTR